MVSIPLLTMFQVVVPSPRSYKTHEILQKSQIGWIDESLWRRLAAIKRNNLRSSVRAGCRIWQKLAGNGRFSGAGDFQPVNYCATRDELRSRFSEQEESWHHSLIPLTSGLRDGKFKMRVVVQPFYNACNGWIEIKELIESKSSWNSIMMMKKICVCLREIPFWRHMIGTTAMTIWSGL